MVTGYIYLNVIMATGYIYLNVMPTGYIYLAVYADRSKIDKLCEKIVFLNLAMQTEIFTKSSVLCNFYKEQNGGLIKSNIINC